MEKRAAEICQGGLQDHQGSGSSLDRTSNINDFIDDDEEIETIGI